MATSPHIGQCLPNCAWRTEGPCETDADCPTSKCTNVAGQLVSVVFPLDDGSRGEERKGYELRGKYTILAEGVRGNLSELAMQRFDLRRNADPQHYGIGIKEVWEIEPDRHEEGLVVHTTGWPLDGIGLGPR